MFMLHCELPLDMALVMAQLFAGDLAVHLPEKNRRTCRVDFFCRSRRAARLLVNELEKLLGRRQGRVWPAFSIRRIKPHDWTEAWKKHFRVRRISRRIVVKPAWKTFSGAKGECVIEMDPGMSFGTGEHPTTQACLRLLDERQLICPRASFLDAGCGSGILAIAAAQLGLAPVTAIDLDPQAVKAAKANCVRNRVAAKVTCRVADVLCLRSSRKYSIIAANLFARVLVRAAVNLAGLLARRDGACLILAGILVAQYPEVAAAFRRRGLREVKTIRSRGWLTAAFEWK